MVIEIEREILKGHIDTIILSLMNRRDMYGYELAKQSREQSSGQFELKEGTMYIALKRLEKSGWIESYWGNEESEGGRRKYYRILPAGKQKLSEKAQEWQAMKSVLDIFLGGVNLEAN